MPGGGAEILVDRVREQVAPGKANTKAWLEVMREAHRQGIPGTATMMFGSVETLEERVEHLRAIRELQDETGGFRAFIPWSFQSGHTPLEGTTEQATGVDYLMTLAVSRLYLDNIPHIQASWVTQGLKMGQVALRFGADDLGSTMIEENVVAATGLRVRPTGTTWCTLSARPGSRRRSGARTTVWCGCLMKKSRPESRPGARGVS